jgi:large-conductance mechanosensitive channel
MKSTHSSRKFLDILKENRLLLIGFSFLIGHSSSMLLKSIINKLLMPFVSLLTDENSWDAATTTIGGVELKWGEPLADLIHFVIAIVLAVYAYKYLEKESPDDRQ